MSAATSRPFVKMNGAGNDFVVVNALETPFTPGHDAVRALGDRKTGEGFDQLIAIEPSETADAFMRVWNADGGVVETCGNALRCVGWMLMQANGSDSVTIDTLGGRTTASRAGVDRITVDMGPPRLDWREIPLAEEMDTRGIELQVGPIDNPVVHTPGAVSMGNPHVVFFTDRQDDGFVIGTGSLIEHHPLFPEGVNVGFANVLAPDRIRLRVFERGAGLTRACGTGACAALVACARRGLTGRKATVIVDGGELEIDWDEASGHVFMTGPVEVERTGVLSLYLPLGEGAWLSRRKPAARPDAPEAPETQMADQTDKQTFSDEEALDFHRLPHPGKISMAPIKPMATQRDLSLAYSPGVAVPVLAIAADPDKAYDYTSKGNLVAVISNGTAILGLGNLGHMASKPVMEGKAVLFKRFADVDSFDIEVKTTDPDEFITVVKNIGDSWGGINLEDIKSPECFVIESELQDLLDIPVFHDDQHGTAIISTAGLINACHLTGRRFEDVKLVLVGAGAAGLSSLSLMKSLGVKPENTTVVDLAGVVYKGRTEHMDQWKSAHATDTDKRTLAEAMVGADAVLGLSAKGAITPAMIASMAPRPIIFAMANPDPEITPEEVLAVRSDAIIATGRSDYVNQVNNVLAFPYLFRGALDVRARQINHEMKIACAHALAQLAREDVPDEVAVAYRGRKLKFGPEYIIPTPFDPRLIWYIPPFVAQAAMDTGVSRVKIDDMDEYRAALRERVDPSAALMQKISSAVRAAPNKRVVFAEGEESTVIRAAWAFKQAELGTPILLGREDLVRRNAAEAGLDFDAMGIEIVNARVSEMNVDYTDWLYAKLQRRGYLRRDVQRMINQDRNYFAAAMLARGQADAMITGTTRNFNMVLKEVRRVLDVEGDSLIGLSIVLAKGRTIFVADTSIHELPSAEELADIAIQAAATVKKLGRTPRVAFLAYSTFGNPPGDRGDKVREAIRILDQRGVDFEYEGEMPPELALDPALRSNYPFMRLSREANVLVMPALHSAAISTQLVQALGGATVIGPLLVGLEKSVQIVSLGAQVSEIITAATFAAYEEGVSIAFEPEDEVEVPHPSAAAEQSMTAAPTV